LNSIRYTLQCNALIQDTPNLHPSFFTYTFFFINMIKSVEWESRKKHEKLLSHYLFEILLDHSNITRFKPFFRYLWAQAIFTLWYAYVWYMHHVPLCTCNCYIFFNSNSATTRLSYSIYVRLTLKQPSQLTS